MARGGARPNAGGKRANAGRKKGGLNKATIERAAIAEQIVERAARSGKKLAIAVLDDFMQLFAGMAAFYQPQPHAPGQPSANQNEDEGKFDKYAALAIDSATALAKYQSPTFKAVHLTQAPLAPVGDAMTEKGGVQRLTPQQAYKLLKNADVIDLVPVVAARSAKKAAGGSGG